MKEEEIINLGFKFIKNYGWYKKYTSEIGTQTKSFYRRALYLELQHTEIWRDGISPMPVIKFLIKEYPHDPDDYAEVLYEGECLSIEELIWIITKTTTLKLIDNKLIDI